MISPRPQFLACYIIMVLVLAGCSTAPPGPRVPVVTQNPIAVEGSAISPITFDGVVISIEPGTLLGFHYEGAGMAKDYDYRWGPSFTEQTKELNDDVLKILGDAGYRTIPWTTGGVKETPAGETVLELRATVTLMEFNSFSLSGGYYQAYCEVLWNLTNPSDGVSLFQAGTEGYKKENEHNAGVFRKAFDQALINLLAEPGFAAAVAGE